MLPNIKHGTGANSLSLSNSSQGASGNYSIAANECIASGNNSIAVGDHTIANKLDLTAVGKFNISSSEDGDLFVVGCGNNNEARENALQVNASKVVINKPTTIDNTENVTGDFTVNTNNTNKFKVTATTGKTEIAGDLEVNSDKFTVDSTTGNTSVDGTLGVSGKLTAEDNIETTKDIKAAGIITTAGIKEDSKKINISKNVNITGDEKKNITGSLTVNSLTVNSDKLVVDNTKVYTSLPLEAKSFKTTSLNVDELIINENETNK